MLTQLLRWLLVPAPVTANLPEEDQGRGRRAVGHRLAIRLSFERLFRQNAALQRFLLLDLSPLAECPEPEVERAADFLILAEQARELRMPDLERACQNQATLWQGVAASSSRAPAREPSAC